LFPHILAFSLINSIPQSCFPSYSEIPHLKK
jgi:hypothetical protein